MTFEFLGNKQGLLNFIIPRIMDEVETTEYSIADIFCGTASVSSAFKRLGLRVVANDNLELCSTFARAVLLNNAEPDFRGIIEDLPFRCENHAITAYERVIWYLNQCSDPKKLDTKSV